MLVASLLVWAAAQDRPVVRAGLQSVGTFSWIAHAIEYYGIDEELGFTFEATTYASKQAADIAMRAGDIDVAVDDFIGVVLSRANGVPVRAIYPYSRATGGVVVPIDAGIDSIEDLQGRTIGAASLDDKSLLILRVLTTSQYGFDPQVEGEVLAAAGFLMQGLLEGGDIDAAIPFWHFVARMEATGNFKNLINVTDMLDQLGLNTDLPILVLVGRETSDPESLSIFIEAMQLAFERMKADSMDGIWQSILDNELYTLPDPTAFPAVRERWEAGLPDVWDQELIDGLVGLVEDLVAVAGADVVGLEEIDPEAFTTVYLR
jgi:NitT/TauT family transport system substrate-binding protein